MYPHEGDQAQEIIAISLMKKRSAAVVALMREAAFAHLKPGMTDEDNHYFSLQYLADPCWESSAFPACRSSSFSAM